MTTVKPEYDLRKYFEYKLMMGFDERYAISKPVGNYSALASQPDAKNVQLRSEKDTDAQTEKKVAEGDIELVTTNF
jgi:hypothetical protein